MMLFKTELPFIEKMVTFYTDQAEVEKQMAEAMEIFKARDARTKDLHDEDVDVFYGCTLCQSFAPTNVCVVSLTEFLSAVQLTGLTAVQRKSGPRRPTVRN